MPSGLEVREDLLEDAEDLKAARGAVEVEPLEAAREIEAEPVETAAREEPDVVHEAAIEEPIIATEEPIRGRSAEEFESVETEATVVDSDGR